MTVAAPLSEDELAAAALIAKASTIVPSTVSTSGTADSPNGGFINVTQGGGSWVYNQLMTGGMPTLVIPSERAGAFGGGRQPRRVDRMRKAATGCFGARLACQGLAWGGAPWPSVAIAMHARTPQPRLPALPPSPARPPAQSWA